MVGFESCVQIVLFTQTQCVPLSSTTYAIYILITINKNGKSISQYCLSSIRRIEIFRYFHWKPACCIVTVSNRLTQYTQYTQQVYGTCIMPSRKFIRVCLQNAKIKNKKTLISWRYISVITICGK